MKNVMVYVNPEKKFNSRFHEGDTLVKIQIDNCYRLGWNPDDIYIYTNFPYQYKDVHTRYIPESIYCPFRPLSTKTCAIAYLLSLEQVDDVWWVHDFDAFQQIPFDVTPEVAGFTDYGWSTKWSLGSYFITPKATELMMKLRDTIYKYKEEDERALVRLTRQNEVSGYTKLNGTYNFGMRKIGVTYPLAEKPLKVIHFHPGHKEMNTLDLFMYGKNEVGVPLMTPELIQVFQSYGIK